MKGKPKVTEIDKEIGERVRVARLEKGLSQKALGAAIGLTFQQVQKYEKGTNRVSASRLRRVAEVLERPVTWFYGECAPAGIEAELGLIKRMLLSGPRGVALADNFTSLPPKQQQQVADMARSLAEGRTAAEPRAA